ncbi:MAG TPA: hypothetical protein VJA22_02515 [Patescibacteria group bacterium]|nr:hypothetical protein [Patescibacteria group bacterium]
MSKYDAFDPYWEKQNIKNTTDPVEKQSKQETFERERIQQKEILATLGGLIIELAVDNPKITEDELMKMVDENAEAGRMADFQRSIFRNIIKERSKRVNDMEKFSEGTKNDQDLFKKIFRFEPEGKIQVDRRPITLHFILPNSEFNQIARNPRDPEAVNAGGLYFPTSNTKGLQGLNYPFKGVVSIAKQIPHYQEEIAAHEETHALYDLMMHGLRKSPIRGLDERHTHPLTNDSTANLLTEVSRTKSETSKIHQLQTFWQKRMNVYSESIKNEIFAFSREGRKKTNVVNSLSKGRGKKGLYDYMAHERSATDNLFLRRANGNDQAIFSEVTKTFFEQEYKKFIHDGITAFETLYRDGFTMEQAMVYFIDISLSQWKSEIEKRSKYKK